MHTYLHTCTYKLPFLHTNRHVFCTYTHTTGLCSHTNTPPHTQSHIHLLMHSIPRAHTITHSLTQSHTRSSPHIPHTFTPSHIHFLTPSHICRSCFPLQSMTPPPPTLARERTPLTLATPTSSGNWAGQVPLTTKTSMTSTMSFLQRAKVASTPLQGGQ